MLVPLHIPTIIAFTIILTGISITEHLGFKIPFYEKVAHIISTPVHHDLHHSVYKCNYAVYFTFWDRVCGTYVPEDAPYAQVIALRRDQLGEAKKVQ